MVNVFNVSAFFIVLREVLEACLVVGIVIAYLHKTGATHLTKYVWYGTILGVILSTIIGIPITVVYYTQGEAKFSGKGEMLFEFVAFLIAAVLLTWMILWMMKMGKNLQTNIEQDVERKIEGESNKAKWGIFFLLFIQVFREGIETFIFLFGAQGADDGPVDKNAWKGILLPGLLGLVVGVVIAYVVFRGLVTFDIQQMFFVSSIILMAFAAALVSRAFHELQEADYLGDYEEVDNIERPWWNAAMWTTKACCNSKTNEFFTTLKVLFGYADRPTFVHYIAYVGYWFIVIPILLGFNWGRICSARNKVAKYLRILVGIAVFSLLIGFIYAVSHPTWTGILTTTVGLLLSIVVCMTSYDMISQAVPRIKDVRRPLLLFASISLALFTIFTALLHIVQMSCLGRSCHLPNFYYWGLIFDQKWLDAPRTEDQDSYNAVAVLAVSFTLTIFFFGAMALLTYLFAKNIGSDGDYIYNDMAKISDTEGGAAGLPRDSYADPVIQ